LKAHGPSIHPERYRLPIEVELFLGKGRFDAAGALLDHVSATDEHTIGLKKKIYLRWARATIDRAEREHTAAMGLAIKFDDALYSNIPILVTSERLANLAGQNELAEEYILRLEHLNPSIAALV
jgi:hypothetical protein